MDKEINLRYGSIAELFLAQCDLYTDNIAYENMGETRDFKQISQQAYAFAYYLKNDLKLQTGDRIAVMMPNLLQYPVVMFGSLLAGLVVVNINPLYTPRELSYQLNDSQVKAIVILENMAHTLAKCIQDTGVEHVVVTSVGEQFSFIKRKLIDIILRHVKKMVPAYSLPAHERLINILKKYQGKKVDRVDVKPTDLALLQYTGGTTGVSKGAMLSHQNILSNIDQTIDVLKKKLTTDEINEGLTVLTVLPLFHIYSFTVNMALMKIGAKALLITNPRDIPGLVHVLKKHKIDVIPILNTLMVALMNNKVFKEINFENLKITITGGMATQKEVAKKWQSITGCMVDQGYGLTETSPVVSTTLTNKSEEFSGGIGRAVLGTEVKVIGKSGRELPVGEDGELCVKGPQVFSGYWQKAEETKHVLSDDGWFKTGDIAKIGSNQELYIVDRIKDMVVSSGFNVYPNEIEEVVSSCPGVLECGVVGIASGRGNEILKAFVVKAEDSLSKSDIVKYCKKNLVSYKVPRRIEFVSELPKTPIGKVLRRKLREKIGNS